MVTTYILPALVFAAIGLIAGVLLTVCSKVFEVKTDERIEAVNEALPQVNCGSCGFSGCSDYANAIVKNGVPTNLCRPGGKDASEKISAIMGMESMETTAQIAVVRCNGSCENTSNKFKFDGISSCKAAKRFYGGSAACSHGCLGYGDCMTVCSNDAITIENGVARIDRSKCLGCGLCAKACPNQLIVVHDVTNRVDVCCSSTEIGKAVRAVCKTGCIGCKKCERTCEFGAITVENNLAHIDYSKCTSCGKCAENCPVHAIQMCTGTPTAVNLDKAAVAK
ncbi:MAG: RnfABCDGE type electron transport complex subunit B [Oscillospiraceae bacterium]|nr:RnfABCDGE type electron transport complex subunit B [Oscillospiraceae bacterium]